MNIVKKAEENRQTDYGGESVRAGTAKKSEKHLMFLPTHSYFEMDVCSTFACLSTESIVSFFLPFSSI